MRWVAEVVKQLKGASSRAVHLSAHVGSNCRWQEGCGALTIGGASLARVIEYVRRQQEHHANGTIVAIYEKMGEPSA